MSATCRKDPDFLSTYVSGPTQNNPETKFLCRELPTQPYHPQPQPCCSAASPLSCHRHPSPATAAATRSKCTGRMGERQQESSGATVAEQQQQQQHQQCSTAVLMNSLRSQRKLSLGSKVSPTKKENMRRRSNSPKCVTWASPSKVSGKKIRNDTQELIRSENMDRRMALVPSH